MAFEIGFACMVVGIAVVSLRVLTAYNRFAEVHKDSDGEK